MRLSSIRYRVLVIAIVFMLVLAGCASEDGGQVVSGILQGIGQGLSGL